MTLLFFDGFENPDTMAKPEWDTANSWLSQTGRNTGGNAASLNANLIKSLTLPSSAATMFMGIAVQVRSSAVFGVSGVVSCISFRTAAADNMSLTFDVNGRLQVRSGAANGTILATGTTAFPLNTWVQLQVKAILSTTNGTVEIRINGSTTPEILLTGVATANATGAVATIRLGNAITTAASAIWFDDMWVCDGVDATATQGRANNDFLGDLKVAMLLPSGAGASTQWTPNTAVANYTTVDEATPNTSDYVSASAAGLRDLYDVADLPTTSPIAQVLGVRAGLYAQKSDVGAASVRTLIRQGNGTVNQGSAIGLGTTFGPVYGPLMATKADGTVWSVADVNAVQVGADSA